MIDPNVTTTSNPETAMQILANRNLPPSLGFNTRNLASRTKESEVSPMKSNFRVSLMGIALLLLALPIPALASLGGDVASVHQDRAQMKGSLKTTQAEAYTVHEIDASAGSVVKEYVSPAGKVFAITWRGQFIPDMRQILGTYFDQYAQAAKAQRESNVGRRPLNIQQPGLVFQNGGHMRSYFGRAYAPDMVPQGVNVDALK
jgi:hypothetical protein